MRGRPPKDPGVRQRRNTIATEAMLELLPGAKPPPLRKAIFNAEEIHTETRRWWRIVWREPMSARWLPSDVLVLETLVVLRNQWYSGTRTIAQADAMARYETRLGLDIMGRKRFDWRIEGPRREDPQPKPTEERAAAVPVDDAIDPRRVLRVVS